MTPPPKNPGPKRPAAKPKTQKSSAHQKSGARPAVPKPPAPKKTGPAKTGTGKKKKTTTKKTASSPYIPVLYAFAAGLVIACLGFWAFKDSFIEKPTPASTQVTVKQTGSHTPAGKPKSTSKPATPAKPAPAGKSGVVRGQVNPEAAKESEKANAVAAALTELQNLPYEEALHAPLDERVRQVDYALMQAMDLSGLPLTALRLTAVEERVHAREAYHFQQISVLPGQDASEFLDAVRGSLAIWAEDAALRDQGNGRWSVTLDGVQTHLLSLFPGRSSFPQDGSPVQAPHVPEQPRMRGRGEAARLVIVIDDLGASKTALDTLLSLQYPVSCAFWPHGAYTRKGAAAAHAKGREVLIHLPMEPLGYPQVKPGPDVLLVGMNAAEIRRTVNAAIAAVPYAAGLNNHMGSRFTQNTPAVDAVLGVLKEQRLFMLDSLTHSRSVFYRQAGTQGVSRYRRNVFLDVDPSKGKVLEELRKAERIALLTGHAVAIGHPLPGTLAALKEWQSIRNKDVRIVRLSDLPQR